MSYLPACRAHCIQVLKTPPPGSGPSKRDNASGQTSDIRATMAATGGRNQRRLANLRTEDTKKITIDPDQHIMSETLVEQQRMNLSTEWNDEKNRLTALVEVSKVVDIPESEKSQNIRALYGFLKAPRVQVTTNKRLKTSNDTYADTN